MLSNQVDVVNIQLETQDRWTKFQNLTARFRHTAISFRKMIFELKKYGIKKRSNKSVFEFGFGHGNLLFWFKPPTKIYGVELSPLALKNANKKAESKGYPDFKFSTPIDSNTVTVDYPNDFFDVILSSHVLEHVYDDQACLKEFYRICKLGGILNICVPHDAKHDKLIKTVDERRKPGGGYHIWRYNVETLKHLIEMEGFKVIKADRFDSITEKRKDWPKLLRSLHVLALNFVPFYFWEIIDNIERSKGISGKQIMILCEKSKI